MTIAAGLRTTTVALVVLFLACAPAADAGFAGTNGPIVFERELPAGSHTQVDVYAMTATGTGLRRLTSTTEFNEFGPTSNAAGTRIAFWRTPAPFGPGSIWTTGASGGTPHRLTTGFDARDPAWSPDGKRVVFTRETADGSDLASMRASDGGDLQEVTTGAPVDFEPSWSPDGTRLAFTRGSADGDVGDIYVLTLATGALTHVTHSSTTDDHQVAWSPDSTQLVFERDADTASSIYTVGANGGSVVRLTRRTFFDVGPAWSPDGTTIAFGSDRSGAFLDDLWLMHADGTDKHDIRPLDGSEAFPDWAPAASLSAAPGTSRSTTRAVP